MRPDVDGGVSPSWLLVEKWAFRCWGFAVGLALFHGRWDLIAVAVAMFAALVFGFTCGYLRRGQQ